MSVPRQAAVWDEKRNTSRTFAAPPGSAKAALEAIGAFRREHPRHADWLAAGAPPIQSEEDHIRWFGESYDRGRRR